MRLGLLRRSASTALAALVVLLGLAVPAALFGPASAAAAYPSSTVVISGHGYGHGIGMGQWGSLGYAIGADSGAGNDTYQQILAHYYGDTTLTSTNDSTAMHGGNVWVAMTEANAIDTIVSASSGSVSYGSGSAPAVLFHQVGSDLFQIETGPGCGGPWLDVGSPVAKPVASPPAGALLNLCTPTATIEVHGTLQAVTNSAGLSRTVNIVPIEQYVADVAPAESPSNWSLLGGTGPAGLSWGFQQSEAQTVAARSYVESDPLGYGGYADTCDQTCQSYPGVKFETLSSASAAADTAGQVLETDGVVATTEYSASSGGYTTGDQFPAVPDDGDAVCVTDVVQHPPRLERLRPGVLRAGRLSPDRDARHHRRHRAERPGRPRGPGGAADRGRLRRFCLGDRRRLRSGVEPALGLVHDRLPAQWRGRGVLDRRLGRRRLQLRERAVLREHRRHAAQPARRGHGDDARRRGLLGGRLGRGRVQLRRRPVPRQHRAASGSTSRWSAWR